MLNQNRCASRVSLCVLGALACGLGAVVPSALAQAINEDLRVWAFDFAADDLFGYSVDIDNGVVAVGSVQDDDNGPNSGGAYVLDAVTGALITKLLPLDGVAGDIFGHSIAIDGGVVAVGTWINADGGIMSGSVYLFNAVTGAQTAKLLANDRAPGDRFGWSVEIDSGVVAVGAVNKGGTGAVYLFDASTGAQLGKLTANDGASGDQFGFSVAMDSGTLVVGAKYHADNGINSGGAYLFDVGTSVQTGELHALDGAPGDQLGWSVAIDGGVVAVGAISDEDNGYFSGSVYLFDANSAAQTAKLLPDDGGGVAYSFGTAVAVDDGVVAVSSPYDSAMAGSGSVHLFDAVSGGQTETLLPSDFSAGQFGWSLAFDRDNVVVGAPYNDINGNDAGAAYVFDLCPADINNDGVVDNGDIGAFITLFLASDPRADFNGDTFLDNGDIAAFIAAFLAGC